MLNVQDARVLKCFNLYFVRNSFSDGFDSKHRFHLRKGREKTSIIDGIILK